jgi:hypothetical protein
LGTGDFALRASKFADVQFPFGNVGDVVISQVENALGVFTMAVALEATRNLINWGMPSSDMKARDCEQAML